ncbi:hypothetical protein [Staphylococcus saprophyticus]|uniref:hypothetical protein n=1 Tax=Staphylococcus saprophyticus TaxID=29385 RepID=UPI001CDA5374|nr:hypothetical protein [Staphylococcus saprophyticus]
MIGLSGCCDLILVEEGRFGVDSENRFKVIKVFEERIKQGERIMMVRDEGEIIGG